jgi:hypothetical protein
MQTNLDAANPAGQLIALPTPQPLTGRKAATRPRLASRPTTALLHARAEAVRSSAVENIVWLALALSAAALVLVSLWAGW